MTYTCTISPKVGSMASIFKTCKKHSFSFGSWCENTENHNNFNITEMYVIFYAIKTIPPKQRLLR